MSSSNTGREPDDVEQLTGISRARRSEMIAQGALSITTAGIDADGRPMIHPFEAGQLAAIAVGIALSSDMRDLCQDGFTRPSVANEVMERIIARIQQAVKMHKDEDRRADASIMKEMLSRNTLFSS